MMVGWTAESLLEVAERLVESLLKVAERLAESLLEVAERLVKVPYPGVRRAP